MSKNLFLLQASVQLLLLVSPLLLKLKVNITNEQERVIRQALGSWDFKLVLCCCVVLTIPLLMEIVRDFFFLTLTSVVRRTFAHNIMLLLILLIPDVIIITCVLPYKNIILYICIHQLRFAIVLSVAYGYLYSFGGTYFRKKGCMLWYICGCLGNQLMLWQAFSPSPAILFIAYGIMLLATMAFAPVVYVWYKRQYDILKCKSRAITTDEYYCNVYLFSLSIFGIGLGAVWVLLGCPDVAHFSSPILIGHNVNYGLFYLIISVFHQGVARRNLISEVCVAQLLK